MKLATEMEWPGSIKYYTVKTGNVNWKGCKILLKQTNNVWCAEVMLKSNEVCPAISFKLIPSTIKRIICKKRLVLEFLDGLMIQFNPNADLLDKVSSFFEDWKNNSTSPKSFNKAEVGVSTPLSDKRINKTPSIERPVRHSFSGKENNEVLPKEKTTRKRDSKLFEETLGENGHDSVSPKMLTTTPKSNGEHFLQRGTEKSQETLASMKTGSFYGKSKSTSLSTLPRRSAGNTKRCSTLNGESTPVKRQRLLVNLSSNSPAKTENTSTSIYPVSKLALRGLTNLGNTCYLNAILQALYSLEPFVSELLYTNRKISKINSSSLHSALANLLVSLRKTEPESSKCTLLDNVREAISTVQKRFSGNDMQDAHECLNQILDHLKEEALKIGSSTPSPNKERLEEESLINPTEHNFEFELEHSLTCLNCSKVVTKIEQYIDLSLDIPRGREPTIQDALDLFLTTETVDYRCEKCDHDKSEVSKRINKLPRVFILHLKRYAYSVTASRHTKVAQLISIPKYLTLARHTSKNVENPPAISLLASPLNLERDITPRRRLDYSDSGSSKIPFFPKTRDCVGKSDDSGIIPLSTSVEDQLTKDESPLYTNGNTTLTNGDLLKPGDDLSMTPSSAPVENQMTKSIESAHYATPTLTNGDLQMVNGKDSENSQIFTDLLKGPTDSDTIVNGKDSQNSEIFTDLLKGPTDSDTIILHNGTTTTKVNKEENAESENGAKYVSSDELMALTDEEMINLAIENSLTLDHLSSKTEDSTCWAQDEETNGNTAFVFNSDPLNLNVPYQQESVQPQTYDVENKENQQPKPIEQPDMTVAIYCPNGDTPTKVNGCVAVTQTEEPKYDVNQEDEDLRKAKEMSLIDLDDGYPPVEENFGVDVDEALKRTKEEMEELKINGEKGNLPNSYQLVSVVAHIGNSSVSGHYLSDVLDLRTDKWYSFDDKEVRQTSEAEVQKVRQDSGYIFFYLSKDIVNNLHLQHQKECF